MATIIPTQVGSDFNTMLFNFLKTPGVEGYEPFVYSDSRIKGVRALNPFLNLFLDVQPLRGKSMESDSIDSPLKQGE